MKNKHSTQEFANPVGSIGRLRLTWGVFLVLFLVGQAYGQVGRITTIAGTGGTRYTGDGGLATAAELGWGTIGGVLDSRGNYYFSVRFHHRIRKISTSGIITTVAGTGTRGYSGDGGPATSAQLNNPFFLAVDTADNLYFAEVEGAKVRKIDARTGVISTVAGNGVLRESGDGGPATAASLKFALSISFDSMQNLFIATDGVTVRKVDRSTQIISKYAGNDSFSTFYGDGGPATAAGLGALYGICHDEKGNLFLSDYVNARIRMIDVTSNVISTIAGNDSFRYNGDGLPATATNLTSYPITIWGNDIYFGDEFNYRLRRLDRLTSRVYNVVGTGVAGQSTNSNTDTSKVYFVAGIAVDPCNNIYFTENGAQYYIKKITYPGNDKPEVTISAQGNAKLCYPMPITFTATVLRGGRGPTYQWQVNGTNVGTNSPTYTYTPTNGDVVRCILTSNLYCVVNPMDTSNSIPVTVFSLSPSTMSLTGPAGGAAGFPVTLGATVSIAGVYTIRWYNHGQLLGTSTTGSFTYTKPTGIDTITAVLIANDRNCYDSVVAGPIYIQHRVGVGEVSSCRYTLSPNPVTSQLHLEGLSINGTMVQVLDVSGRQQWQATLSTTAANIDMSTLPTGVYVLQLTDLTTGERVVERVVK